MKKLAEKLMQKETKITDEREVVSIATETIGEIIGITESEFKSKYEYIGSFHRFGEESNKFVSFLFLDPDEATSRTIRISYAANPSTQNKHYLHFEYGCGSKIYGNNTDNDLYGIEPEGKIESCSDASISTHVWISTTKNLIALTVLEDAEGNRSIDLQKFKLHWTYEIVKQELHYVANSEGDYFAHAYYGDVMVARRGSDVYKVRQIIGIHIDRDRNLVEMYQEPFDPILWVNYEVHDGAVYLTIDRDYFVVSLTELTQSLKRKIESMILKDKK